MKKYNPKEIEKKWRERWAQSGVYEPDFTRAKNPFYSLMMFPYPSAEGLHAGNMYAFTGTDVYARFKRMQGYDVFEPIGLDGFGIHSENYAIKAGRHPAEQAKRSEKNFYRQLQMIGNGFAWRERLETYDPEYYRWTQWIFVQLFKKGLAYRKKATVNWCPECKTVLADEQVLNGECERCAAAVIKKELEQWFFRITNYAEKLLNNLETIDWSEKVKTAQRNWIGRSEGATIKFQITNNKLQINSKSKNSKKNYIEVFTTRPDTLFGATYMVLSPEHSFVEDYKSQIINYKEVGDYIKNAKTKTNEERITEGKEKTGVEIKGVKAVNPATKQEIPIWVADYVLGNVGTGAIMAVPAHDERDFEFANAFGLPVRKVIEPPAIAPEPIPGQAIPHAKIEADCWTGEGKLINSGKFNGMDSEKAKDVVTKYVSGEKKVQYRLRDWLISRQRYWGPPIPMIYCLSCAENNRGEQDEMPGWYSVPEKDLPVTLPHIENFRPTGTDKPPLAQSPDFYNTSCPDCGADARRETDVSDTFLDSAWYYIGYLMAAYDWKLEIGNSKLQEAVRKWLPVDIYIGGAEHSVLHLLYVRFLAMALNDMNVIDFAEPFPKFRAHGLLIKDGAKMSKSKGNIVNPDEYIQAVGADALRMYLMFLSPFEEESDFRDAGIKGITRFLERVWKLVLNSTRHAASIKESGESRNKEFEKYIHRAIKKVTEDVESLHYNTAISELMKLLNEFEAYNKNYQLSVTNYEVFLKLLHPFAPHITEELWEMLGYEPFIVKESWPAYDETMFVEESVNVIVQVNGKFKTTLTVPADTEQKDVERSALDHEKVQRALNGQQPKKMIFVKNKLLNIVI